MANAENPATARVSGVCKELGLDVPADFIFVDTETQTLERCAAGDAEPSLTMICDISTSRFGIGNREGSNMTPLGLHIIEEKIGEGARPFTIFRSRKDTGEVWREGIEDDNLILTRILRLRGLEEGVNAGPGIDSYGRYIYIHGTNREDLIGRPMSHGCVCMRNEDVIRLFDMVDVGTLVYIG